MFINLIIISYFAEACKSSLKSGISFEKNVKILLAMSAFAI